MGEELNGNMCANASIYCAVEDIKRHKLWEPGISTAKTYKIEYSTTKH